MGSKKLLIGLLEDNPEHQMARLWKSLEERGHRILYWKTLKQAYDYLDHEEFGTLKPAPDRMVVDLILKPSTDDPARDTADFGPKGKAMGGLLGLGILRYLAETLRVPPGSVIVLSNEVDTARLEGGAVDLLSRWGFENFVSKARAPVDSAIGWIEEPGSIPRMPTRKA